MRDRKISKIMNVELPVYQDDDKTHVALVQPGSWGDNIISTLMFKPLMAKYSNLSLDVYTSTSYESAFHNNPHIHRLLPFPSTSKNTALHLVKVIPDLLAGRGYKHIYTPHPMINPDKWTSINNGYLGDHFMCAWIRALEESEIPYTMPLEIIMRLTDAEVEKVRQYTSNISRFNDTKRNLMEVGGESGQSFFDHNWMMAVARLICGKGELLFISSRDCGPSIVELIRQYPGLCHHIGHLSIREAAELYNHCHRFFSISSGLSNACNSNWCKTDIEWYEVVNSTAINSAPIRSTGKTFWYQNDVGQFVDMLRSKI